MSKRCINVLRLAHPKNLLVGGLVLWLLCVSWAPVSADDPNRVGLVVAHGGTVIKKCVSFSGDKISGYDVLEGAGLEVVAEAYSGMGGAVCAIDGEGCFPSKGDECFCKCKMDGSQDKCVYWSYWHLKDGSWQYSSKGAGAYKVSSGAVEGWMWGTGTTSDASEPPMFSFDELCPASPTPTATNTPQPTATNTPEKEEKPTIDYFTADRTTIAAGESVQLSWDLDDADEAYLEVNGARQGVTAPYSLVVNPTETTTYRLLARNDAGDVDKKITITVSGTAATPAPADAAGVTEEVTPAAAAPAGDGTTHTGAADPAQPTSAVSLVSTDVQAAEVTATQAPATAPPVTPTPTWTPIPLLTAQMVALVEPSPTPKPRSDQTVLLRETATPTGLADSIPVVAVVVVGVGAIAGGCLALLAIVLNSRRRV